MIYKKLIRPVLFLFDAESVHDFVLKFLSKSSFLYPVFKKIYSPVLNQEIIIKKFIFKNPLGLAAGFDKNGIAIRFWEAIGFSHVEIGTVTPLPQKGNEKPRIFRLRKDEALINRLGFNNKGTDEIRENILRARKFVNKDFVIGVNIGKNKVTPIKDAVSDYMICFRKMFDVADYFTINISSPNTEGLRMLHEKEHLEKLLAEIQNLNIEISKSKSSSVKCIFLKIAPDLTEEMTEMIYSVSVKNNITGIIATNTTVERINLKSDVSEQGGLSGKPLKPLSDNILKKLNRLNKNNELVLIGVGGIFNRSDYDDKINSGAMFIQIYTGFIYEGPAVIKNILSK